MFSDFVLNSRHVSSLDKYFSLSSLCPTLALFLGLVLLTILWTSTDLHGMMNVLGKSPFSFLFHLRTSRHVFFFVYGQGKSIANLLITVYRKAAPKLKFAFQQPLVVVALEISIYRVSRKHMFAMLYSVEMDLRNETLCLQLFSTWSWRKTELSLDIFLQHCQGVPPCLALHRRESDTVLFAKREKAPLLPAARSSLRTLQLPVRICSLAVNFRDKNLVS